MEGHGRAKALGQKQIRLFEKYQDLLERLCRMRMNEGQNQDRTVEITYLQSVSKKGP